MRLRSHALVLLGAFALLWASTVAHGHGNEPRLEASCAVCATQVQRVAPPPEPTALPARAPIAIELFHPAPLSRDLPSGSGAEPRGPPRTV
jgi:hypothetical protein